MADPTVGEAAPVEPASGGDLKRRLLLGGIVFGCLIVVVVALVSTVPELAGIRTAIASASPGWVLAAFCFQLLGTIGAVVFVQEVFDDLPRRLSWWQGCGQQGANAILTTTGSTAVSFLTVRAVGWSLYRFAERTAVMIIAPSAPNLVLTVIFGAGMGLGVFAGPDDWRLGWLPAAAALIIMLACVGAAVWAERIAARVKSRRIAQAVTVVATGVTGTVAILRRHSWRVGGSWARVLGSMAALWAALHAVGQPLPLGAVAMAYLIGLIAMMIPVPGGVGTVDVAVSVALVLYGATSGPAEAAELIWHASLLVTPLLVGVPAIYFLPRQIAKTRAHAAAT